MARRTRAYFETLSSSSIGLELAVAVILGLLFGRWLDGRLGTTPWMMIAWLVVGFIAGMRAVLRFVARDARAVDGPASTSGEAVVGAGESKPVKV